MNVRTGIDLVSVASVDESVREHGRRYLERVFTARELEDCRRGESVAVEKLAARHAAKEAAMKVLRVSPREAIPWTSIEYVREPGGWGHITLSGPAQALAVREGVGELAVSVTHEGDYAAAVVVALVESKDRG